MSFIPENILWDNNERSFLKYPKFMEKNEHLPSKQGERAPWAASGHCNVGIGEGTGRFSKGNPERGWGQGKF